jgi:hypothetical protein
MLIRASDFGAAQSENPAFAKFTNHVDSMTKFLLLIYAVSVNATNMTRTDSICRGKS